jgi:3',5'-cyclic-AMP phosphodiesterase
VNASDGRENGMDQIDRRGFFQCLAWVGTGVLWASAGGVLSSRLITDAAAADPTAGGFTFAQISDTHIGFKGQANSDPVASLKQVVDRVNALQPAPAFVLHTGDQTHGQKAGAFDTVAEILKTVKAERIFYVPGEHDVFLDGGKEYLGRYGKGTVDGRGWQSFDYKGTHFVGLVNVLKYKGEGMGSLGDEQLEWLEKDVAPLSSSTPIVVFSHVPLWAVYPQWGWTTEDAERALAYLRRFGSVTVLNGHIHQVLRKVEGTIAFHTALSTAFPQPAPGSAPAPGPMKIPEEQARRMIGVTDVTYVPGKQALAVVDSTLS